MYVDLPAASRRSCHCLCCAAGLQACLGVPWPALHWHVLTCMCAHVVRYQGTRAGPIGASGDARLLSPLFILRLIDKHLVQLLQASSGVSERFHAVASCCLICTQRCRRRPTMGALHMIMHVRQPLLTSYLRLRCRRQALRVWQADHRTTSCLLSRCHELTLPIAPVSSLEAGF